MRRSFLARWEKDALLIAGGNGIAQALAVVSMPVLTRLYSPADFGAFAVYLSVYGIALVGCSLRYQQAILLPKAERPALALLVLSVALIGPYLLVATLSTVVVIRWAEWVGPGSPLYHLAWILPLSLAAGAIAEVLSYWPLRNGQYRLLASARVTQMGGVIGGQVALGAIGAGPVGLVLGDALGRAAESLRYLLGSIGRERWRIATLTRRDIAAQAIQYRRFPQLALPAGIVSAAGTYLPPVVVIIFFGAGPTGSFFFSWKVIAIPVALLGASLGQAFTGHGARLVRRNESGMRSQVRSIARRLFLLSIIPATALATIGPAAFRFVFGSEWAQAGFIAAGMAPALVALTVAAPFNYVLILIQRQELQLLWDVFRVVLTLAAMTIAAVIFETPEAAALAFSLAAVSSTLLVLFLIDRALASRSSDGP